ncbi:hypothetical protein [Viridibacillus arvi]|uniref:hypothetical protein n=1 Tax=Viridibacillus arvi TaxID=263475 RepID=UPI0034CD3666
MNIYSNRIEKIENNAKEMNNNIPFIICIESADYNHWKSFINHTLKNIHDQYVPGKFNTFQTGLFDRLYKGIDVECINRFELSFLELVILHDSLDMYVDVLILMQGSSTGKNISTMSKYTKILRKKLETNNKLYEETVLFVVKELKNSY